MTVEQGKRLAVVFLLGFASGLPFTLLGSTLQAWYVDAGLTFRQVGLLSLLGLPYIFRVFFAPLVDYFQFSWMGKRRTWMLLTQAILLCGFNLVAWTNPEVAPIRIALFALALSWCSAMQDVAIDAQRIEYLSKEEYGIGASYAMLGYHIAMLVGGGGALILAEYMGWSQMYRVMGLFMAFGLLATLWSAEPKSFVEEVKGWGMWKAPFHALLEKPHWISLCLFIFFYKIADGFTGTASGIAIPFLKQALHFSNAAIGYMYKGVGFLAWVTGALIAGYGLKKWSLYKTLLACGVLHAFSVLLWQALAMEGGKWLLLVATVFAGNVVSGLTTIALMAFLMHVTDKRYTATQFALLVAISALPRCFSGPVGAWIHTHGGWVALYQWVFVLSLLFIPFLYHMRYDCKEEAVSLAVSD